MLSLPDAVTREVTWMDRMRMAMESPGSAPWTKTGCVTSCPPRMAGVSMGPQQPGAVLATMMPPSSTGPSMATSGPRMPLVKVLTKTVLFATSVLLF